MNDKKFHLISLGCEKNTVDSQSIAQLLINSQYHPTTNPEDANILIVNTCGFIGPAKEESFQMLENLSKIKTNKQKLIAAGCLTQRYGKEVVERVPGIDGVLGTRRWMDIMELVNQLRDSKNKEPIYHLPSEALTVGKDEKNTLRISGVGASAYIKIADGCRRPCAFCAIPLIKGTAVSRPIDSILSEALHLQKQGVRELNLIAQDTTDYGHDLGIKNGLPQLLKRLTSEAPDINWIRILYAYPGYVSDELIEVMATHEQVLSYIDMPLQHAHPDTLKRMKRPANVDWVFRTIEKLRNAMPNLALRTTFIVGYPGETEEEFETLLDFVKEIRFDRLGVFEFSFEPGTSSEALGDPIPEEIKKDRQHQIMTLQQKISMEINQGFIGKNIDVLIESYDENKESNKPIAIGRTYRDAPDIDGLVFVEGKPPIGEIIPTRINGAMPYDLSGFVETNNLIITLDK